MHTFSYENYDIHYNSDLSGDVEINHLCSPNQEASFTVKGEVLIEFIASWVRSQKIRETECMSGRELLGLKDE